MKQISKLLFTNSKIFYENFPTDEDLEGVAECPYCNKEAFIQCCDNHNTLPTSSNLHCPSCDIPERCSHFNYYENDIATFSKNSYINKDKCSPVGYNKPGVNLHTAIHSFNRLSYFINYIPVLNDAEYWYCLRKCSQYSDNTYRYRGLLQLLFSAKKPYRNNLMKKSEVEFIKGLPDKVDIFRAMTVEEKKNNSYGVSWTLDRKVAKHFRDKYEGNYATEGKVKTIKKITIDKKDIIAYLPSRKEEEIIYVNKNNLVINESNIREQLPEFDDTFLKILIGVLEGVY